MKLQTLSTGAANLHVEGVDFLIERNSSGIWEAFLDGQGKALCSAITRKICAEQVLEILGISGKVTAGGRPSKSRASAKPAKSQGRKACVIQNPKGLFVFGFEQVLEILADSLANAGLPGLVDTAHRTQSGKICAFVAPGVSGDFWSLVQGLCQGEEFVVNGARPGEWFAKTVN